MRTGAKERYIISDNRHTLIGVKNMSSNRNSISSDYKNTFTMDQIKLMSTSELYAQIGRYQSLIDEANRKGDSQVQLEREFCYLERERLNRERNKQNKR